MIEYSRWCLNTMHADDVHDCMIALNGQSKKYTYYFYSCIKWPTIIVCKLSNSKIRHPVVLKEHHFSSEINVL